MQLVTLKNFYIRFRYIRIVIFQLDNNVTVFNKVDNQMRSLTR